MASTYRRYEKLINIKFLTESLIVLLVTAFVTMRTSYATSYTIWAAMIIFNTFILLVFEQLNIQKTLLKDTFKSNSLQNYGFIYANLTVLSVVAVQTENYSFYLENAQKADVIRYASHFMSTYILIISNFMTFSSLVANGFCSIMAVLIYLNFPENQYNPFIAFLLILIVAGSIGIFVHISDKIFTFAEASLLIQSFWIAYFDFYLRFLKINNFYLTNVELSIVLEIMLFLVVPIIIVLVLSHFVMKVSNIAYNYCCHFMVFFLLLIIFLLILCHDIIQPTINKVLEIFFLLFKSKLLLFLYWFILVLFSFFVVYWYAKTAHNNRIPKTIVRKIFHLIAVLIFLCGWSNSELLALVSTLVFCVFVVAEVLRAKNYARVGIFLNKFLEPFRDDNDSGKLILSHLYLIFGMSLPFWLTPKSVLNGKNLKSLSIFSGVISLGIGDTCASIFGKLYGKKKWSESNKSYIGTICCFLSQVSFVILLMKCLSIYISFNRIYAVCLVCLVISLLETFSSQTDNLILPVYMYVLFMQC